MIPSSRATTTPAAAAESSRSSATALEGEEKKDLNPGEIVSYCLGYQAGKQLQAQFQQMDVDLLIRGLRDAILQQKPLMEESVIQHNLQRLNQVMAEGQKKALDLLATQNRKAGEDFLTKNKGQPEVITLTSGLQYKVLKTGDGATPTSNGFALFRYRGICIDGRVFADTYKGEKPIRAQVNTCIPGWSEALTRMKVGDKWQLFIPHALAFGERGEPRCKIGPCETVIFEMELFGVEAFKP
jgi:FKBP-type peptidyl-prolyl cis-trans isomerase FklB